ncbi:M23 family metallopeptidase [Streptomyces sp. NBC_01217]|uniref:M23 family metallopeptidase n=1 Tax=Streptomyces sp. NBC_01217 TaxID=2903779 RepID=UPI002E0DF6D5|nr:M23 family metallopeptidase [Streptomyces sp. NBC_01217]
MNDQHPHAGYAGYDSQATGSFDSDPLFGSLPGSHDGTYDGTYTGGYDTGQAAGYSGQYDSTQWGTGTHHTTAYDAYAPYAAQPQQPQQQYDPGTTYDTTATWTPAATTYADIPAQGCAPDGTGQWDANGWYQSGQWPTADTAPYDTGAYDATAWNVGVTPEHEQQHEQQHDQQHEYQAAHTTQTAQVLHEAPTTHEAHQPYESYADQDSFDFDFDPYEPHQTSEFSLHETEPAAETATDTDVDTDGYEGAGETGTDTPPDTHRPVNRPATRSGGSRSRRRSPAKRSALLTVAVPSACVMSVAGIAAASVSGMGGEDKKDDSTTMAAADSGSVKPVAANNKLDTQLANLSADAENFADRASRTQERIDLRERQAAEKKKREEEAARKEALRPKYVMPVAQHGLSAYFGQAGVNWMSVHTGIDFPVSYGTPVMAATDGTVRTQWNNAYGNMAIVTMADGTETWYCHLSSTKIRSGPVKAGDVIAYSGNSGNSTGPHMHFEVRPGGGAAIDPLPWLRSHGVDPT